MACISIFQICSHLKYIFHDFKTCMFKHSRISNLFLFILMCFKLQFKPDKKKCNMMTKAKKGKKAMITSQSTPSTSDVIEIPSLFLNTTCTIDTGTSSWESMYQLIESEGPKVIQRVEIMDAASSSEASNYEATNSFLHKIVA